MTVCSRCARLHEADAPCLRGPVAVLGPRDYADGHALAVLLDLVALRVVVAGLVASDGPGAPRLAVAWARRRGVVRVADCAPALQVTVGGSVPAVLGSVVEAHHEHAGRWLAEWGTSDADSVRRADVAALRTLRAYLARV